MHKARSSIEEVPYCFSRSFVMFHGHTGQKNRRFWVELSVSGQQLQFEFTVGFEMMHKAWCNVEEVPYNFFEVISHISRSHGCKINDLNPIWVRLLGRSQLSNPSDLPCWYMLLNFAGWRCYTCNLHLNHQEKHWWVAKTNTSKLLVCCVEKLHFHFQK